jgi:hypothetical protein
MKKIGFAMLGVQLAVLAACGHSSDKKVIGNSTAPTTSDQGQLPVVSLSEAEKRFGVSPTRNKEVVYQPDVIIMEHGAEAIRSYSSNGLTWTIDANAPHAAEIQRDKILFATGRAVGRVLKVERKGDNLDVTLGPVELTDVIEEAHIHYEGALDTSQMMVYYAPDFPGTYTDLSEPATASTSVMREFPSLRFAARSETGASLRSAVWTDDERTAFGFLKVASAPVSSGSNSLVDLHVNDYTLSPFTDGGLGVKIHYKKDGLEFEAHAALTLQNPHISMNLDVIHGLKTAEVVVTGVGGIEVEIAGRTSNDFKNVSAVIEIPADYSFPIAGLGVPFSVIFHQSILITTLFAAKEARINAEGSYQYGGEIKAGLWNGHLRVTAPTVTGSKKEFADTLDGASAGVNGAVIGYGGKVLVGIGAFGFAVGPYVSVNTSIGGTRGSDLQIPLVGYTCKTAQLKLTLDYGVGYAIPGVVVAAINEFLGLFHAKSISASHGTQLDTKVIYEKSTGVPPSCDKP